MKVHLKYLFFLTLFSNVMALGMNCPPHALVPANTLKFRGNTALVVTHPSTHFDGRMSSKVGMDATVRWAKSKGYTVTYLQDDPSDKGYFFEDCNPDAWVHSEGGEFKANFTPQHLVSVGGHWELCQRETIADVLMSWKNQESTDHSITVFMDAVYSKGSESINESDPYYNDFNRFVGIVNYGRGGEAFSNKLTLLEFMGIIIKPQQQENFLMRNLPIFSRTLPTYKVTFRLNDGRTRTLQQGISGAPILHFQFYNSAESLP